jgi:predicted RNA binding protein YcfA (HicA-like mRNA interferase family)
MSKRDKLRRKLRNNPRGVKFSELETLLVRFDFTLVRVTGSHHIFRYGDGNGNPKLVIPVHGNNIKPEYVTSVVETLDKLFPETEDDEESENED